MSLYARLVAIALLALTLVAGWWKLTTHYERIGYDRRKAEDETAQRAQETRNRELQRAAELRYTVQAGVREQFLVETVTEIRHDTENLAACVLSAAARDRLRRAAECAGPNPAAACGAGDAVRPAR